VQAVKDASFYSTTGETERLGNVTLTQSTEISKGFKLRVSGREAMQSLREIDTIRASR
jgi:hypothetical protein